MGIDGSSAARSHDDIDGDNIRGITQVDIPVDPGWIIHSLTYWQYGAGTGHNNGTSVHLITIDSGDSIGVYYQDVVYGDWVEENNSGLELTDLTHLVFQVIVNAGETADTRIDDITICYVGIPPTPTFTPSDTLTPSQTHTPGPTSTGTITRTPTRTPLVIASPTRSNTPVPTFTLPPLGTLPPALPTRTFVPSPTRVISATPDMTATPTPPGDGGGPPIDCAGTILGPIGCILQTIGDFFSWLINAFLNFIDWLLSLVRWLIGTISNLFTFLGNLLQGLAALIQFLIDAINLIAHIVFLVLQIIFGLLEKFIGWLFQWVGVIQGVINSWQTASPTPIPSLPNCITEPALSDICAVYYLVQYTILGGALGQLMILMLKIIIGLNTLFYFIITFNNIMDVIQDITNG